MTTAFALPELDLRGVTREGSETYIAIQDIEFYGGKKGHVWITCGRIELSDLQPGRVVELGARARPGVTDFEHDTAWIFRIPLVGVSVLRIANGWTFFEAWILGADNHSYQLRVPSESGYDPTKLPEASVCTDCRESHPVVPEGYYSGPPFNPVLWKHIRGRRIDVATGPVP